MVSSAMVRTFCVIVLVGLLISTSAKPLKTNKISLAKWKAHAEYKESTKERASSPRSYHSKKYILASAHAKTDCGMTLPETTAADAPTSPVVHDESNTDMPSTSVIQIETTTNTSTSSIVETKPKTDDAPQSQIGPEPIQTSGEEVEGIFDVRDQSIGEGALFDDSLPVEPPEMDDPEFECLEGEFQLENGVDCQTCDPQCLPERCVDIFGCVGCNSGYYYVRPSPEEPFECRKCTIENCIHCKDGVVGDEQPSKCIQCANGYVLTMDSLACIPITEAASSTFESITSGGGSETVSTSSGSGTGTVSITYGSSHQSHNDENTETSSIAYSSPCLASQFLSPVGNQCLKCDLHALGGCRDFTGCLGCMPGFYRRRAAPYFPFICLPCTVEHCIECENDIDCYFDPRCRVCEQGYQVDASTGLCI